MIIDDQVEPLWPPIHPLLVGVREAAWYVEGYEKVVAVPEALRYPIGKVSFDLASCERDRKLGGKPRDFVEIFYRIAPVATIEIDYAFEIPVAYYQVGRMEVVVLEANGASRRSSMFDSMHPLISFWCLKVKPYFLS